MTNSVLEMMKNKGQTTLGETEAKEALKAAGIPINDTVVTSTREEAVKTADRLGYPVVLKIVSADVLHKTEAKGVELNLANGGEVAAAYDRIINATRERYPQAVIDGVSVQKMIPKGVEVIVGMSKDPQFGPMVMFGLGGIFVELFKDVSFKIVPLTKADAEDMLDEIKGSALLKGFRGSEPVNREALVDTLVKLSALIDAHPEIEEMDINPLFAGKEGVIAADARMILSWE
ncbi:MAG: acetate--CoA ligase family protein [Bacillota bacterium]